MNEPRPTQSGTAWNTATAVAALLVVSLLHFPLLVADAGLAQTSPLADFDRAWRDDRSWFDGRAECAVYRAVRPIYGVPREYRARLFVNKERVSAETKTKGGGADGRSAFKFHLREDVPTKNYDYHFSTMCYVGVDDLKSLKIDMGSQEDCGATFKQVVNHDGVLRWQQFSYFPNEGAGSGEYPGRADVVFQDALGLILRGYPFDAPRAFPLRLVPDQTTTKWSPMNPVPATVTYVGRESITVPAGKIDTHHLRVDGESGPRYDYWFAVESGPVRPGVPGLHALVRHTSSDGQRLDLISIERRAYWAN